MRSCAAGCRWHATNCANPGVSARWPGANAPAARQRARANATGKTLRASWHKSAHWRYARVLRRQPAKPDVFKEKNDVTALLPQPDPEGLLEYSVVYTDRALNHMSQRFQGVMKDISRLLKQVYHADATAIVPGSGTFGMEAVARQFATDQKVLVIRNGWFSFRWTQIFEMGRIPADTQVLKARQVGSGPQAPFAPAPIDEVVATIRARPPSRDRWRPGNRYRAG